MIFFFTHLQHLFEAFNKIICPKNIEVNFLKLQASSFNSIFSLIISSQNSSLCLVDAQQKDAQSVKIPRWHQFAILALHHLHHVENLHAVPINLVARVMHRNQMFLHRRIELPVAVQNVEQIKKNVLNVTQVAKLIKIEWWKTEYPLNY